MHISLTPELEASIKKKVASGYYNNASEVVRDALRFWEKNEELVEHIKLEALRKRLAIGAAQAEKGELLNQTVEEVLAGVRDG